MRREGKPPADLAAPPARRGRTGRLLPRRGVVVLLVAGVTVAAGAWAARRGDPPPPPTGGIGFETLFVPEATIQLQADPEDPIGLVAAVVPWNGDLAVVDLQQANIKLYAPDGRLRRTLGGAGDGPGEFRAPRWAAALPDGGLAVYDALSSTITRFDRSGAFVRRLNVPAHRVGALHAAGPAGELLLSGYGADAAGDVFDALHVVDGAGALVQSFGPLPANRRAEETLLADIHAIRVGSAVVAMKRTGPGVVIRHANGGTVNADAAGAGYRPPRWRRFAGMHQFEAIKRWANRQMWVTALIPLDSTRFAVAFSIAGDGSDTGITHYSVLDVQGRHHAVTAPGGHLLSPLSPGRAYEVTLHDEGGATLAIYRARAAAPARTAATHD